MTQTDSLKTYQRDFFFAHSYRKNDFQFLKKNTNPHQSGNLGYFSQRNNRKKKKEIMEKTTGSPRAVQPCAEMPSGSTEGWVALRPKKTTAGSTGEISMHHLLTSLLPATLCLQHPPRFIACLRIGNFSKCIWEESL